MQEIALKSLQRMATHSGAHHVLLEQSGILHTLMILLLEAHTAAVAQASAPVAAKPTKANTGGTNAAADAQKQVQQGRQFLLAYSLHNMDVMCRSLLRSITQAAFYSCLQPRQ